MGCNGYGGSADTGKFTTKRDGNFVLIPPMAITVQLCSEPEGIMEQEAEYIEALNRITRFQSEGDRLELLDATGEISLTFIKK
jgi:heat shock protein HslJ